MHKPFSHSVVPGTDKETPETEYIFIKENHLNTSTAKCPK